MHWLLHEVKYSSWRVVKTSLARRVAFLNNWALVLKVVYLALNVVLAVINPHDFVIQGTQDLEDLTLVLVLPVHELLLKLGLVFPELLYYHWRLLLKFLVEKFLIPLAILIPNRVLKFLKIGVDDSSPLVLVESKFLFVIVIVVCQVDVHVPPEVVVPD